jgi:hypothetical protein
VPLRTHQNAGLLTFRGSEIESNGSSLLPLDSEDRVSKRVESALNDVQWMRVNEFRWFVRDRCCAVVDLQMNWAEVVVRIVLMPANKQIPVWLDPVEPVVLVRLAGLHLNPNLDPRSRHRVLVVTKELAWVYLSDDPVRASFTRLSTSPPNVLELTAESVLDAVVESLTL